jgi:PAS domain S-box-containing protein
VTEVVDAGADELRRRLAQLESLARVASAVDRLERVNEVFDVALEELIAETSASRASLLLFDDEGVMRFRAWRGLSDEYRTAVDGHSPWTVDEPDPRPITIGDVGEDPSLGSLRENVLREGIRALAFVPLLHRARLVGKFMLYRDEPGDFSEAELRFAQTIGSHVAAAAERRRSETELLESRAELEAILGQVADGISVQGRDGSIVYANDAAARLVGFDSAAEFLATPVADVIARFEMFDEDGRPFDLERLPGRLALAGVASEQVICYRIRDTGARLWSVVRATPIADPDGSIRFAVSAFQDITPQKQAEERLRVLAEASNLLSSLDYHATLEEIPKLVVPGLAEACSVWYAERGTLRRLSSYTENTAKQAAFDAIPSEFSLDDDTDTLMVELFNAGEPVLLEDISQATLRTAARDDDEIAAVDQLASRSAIVVPLVARGRSFGLLNLISFVPGRFRAEDVALAKELTDRVALALDRALLFRASEEARGRLEYLARAGRDLNATLDYEGTLAALGALVVPRLATWAGFYLVEDGEVRRMFGVHGDEKMRDLVEETARRYPFDLTNVEQPIPGALFAGRSSLFEHVTDEALRATANDAEHYEAMKRLGFRTAIVVPLQSSGRLIGAMTLVRTEGEDYSEADLRVAEDLGRRAGVAIENARNYARAQARARAAQALEFIRDGVCLVDAEGLVQLWNPTAEAITERKAHDVIGRPASEVLRGLTDVGERPETRPVDVDGRELWLSISAAQFPEGTVYAFRDVTDERALDRLKNDFVSTISHELRTPLAAIYGAAVTVRRDDPGVREHKDALLGVIAAETERLARTIDAVLSVSRLETGTLHVRIESCDPGELLDGVVAAACVNLPQNLAIERSDAEAVPRIAADPDKVRQVLGNLVDNAVKYSPDGGTIRVGVEGAGRSVRFVVRDEGLGIPQGERERVFEKFYRLDPNLTRGVGGTGLGLYICRELVARMDGRVTVESNGSRGSTFAVELPVA